MKFLESKFQLHYKSVKDSFIARVKNYLERDGYFDWKPLRYFLYEYEDYLYVSSKRLDQIPATCRPATKGYYSIEHIYPQKPQDWYWENQFRDYSTTEREMCIKALGNMLLLANDINASLQNHSYKRKCKPLNKERTGYINGSFSERKVANENNDWNPLNIYRRTIELLDFFGRRWNINFDKKEKIVLSGMDFMETKREVSKELFSSINLFEEMSNQFEEAGYIVNIENRYIQFIQKEWIFDDRIHTSIHFELKLNKESFENLLGEKIPIQLVFHTESACPVKLKNQLKQLRRKIGKQEIENDFTTKEKCIESVQSINSHVANVLEEYSHEISEIVKKYKQENLS